MSPWPYPRWIAHRGAGKLAPENTLAAFRLGARHGYRAFECDVKLSADGVPFLLHDATLQRTTRGHGRAADLRWSELARPRRRLVAQPRLRRRAAGVARRRGRVLPRERPRAQHRDQADARAARPRPGASSPSTARRLWRRAALPPLFSSFQPAALAAAQAAAPAIPRALLLDSLRTGWLEEAKALGCVAVVTAYPLMDAAVLATAACRGPARALLHGQRSGRGGAARRVGIDAIITDAVDRFRPSAGGSLDAARAAATRWMLIGLVGMRRSTWRCASPSSCCSGR
jgi:glycerophosphoryl diester phosphodiesterase